MRKLLYSEFILFIHTVLLFIFSSSASYVWYLNYFSIFTFGVLFLELYLFKKGRIGAEWTWFFVPLFLLAGMSLLAALLDPITMRWAFRISYAYVLAFMYYAAVVSTGRIWFLSLGLVLSMLFIALTQGFDAVSVAVESGRRGKILIGSDTGDQLNVNVYALICLCSLAFCLFYAIESMRLFRSRVIGWGIRLGGLLAILVAMQQIIIVTGSRKGMVFVLFWMCVAGLMLMRGRIKLERILVAGIAGAMLTVVALIALYYSPFFWRFEEIFYSLTSQFSDEQSFTTRSEYIRVGVQMWLASPIWGDFLRFYKTIGTYTHSNVVDLLVNHGVIGITLYYSYYVMFFKKVLLPVFRSKIDFLTARCIFLGAFVAMYFLWELAAVNYYSRYSLPVVGVLLGMGVTDIRRLRGLRPHRV